MARRGGGAAAAEPTEVAEEPVPEAHVTEQVGQKETRSAAPVPPLLLSQGMGFWDAGPFYLGVVS